MGDSSPTRVSPSESSVVGSGDDPDGSVDDVESIYQMDAMNMAVVSCSNHPRSVNSRQQRSNLKLQVPT